jgi:outer membrane protein
LQPYALGAKSSKIAVVDIQKLQSKSTTFQKERAKLKKTFDAMQKKLDAEKKALLKLEEDFKKQSMMLSLDAQEDKKRDLEKKRRYYKYLYEDLTQEMKNAEIQVTKKIGKDLQVIVKKVAEKEGYILILERRTIGLLFYDDVIDITDQVTEIYDRSKK